MVAEKQRDRLTRIEFTHVQVGGQNVGFDPADGTLTIAGEDWTPERWLTLVDKIGKSLIRGGFQEAPQRRDPNARTSQFLTANLDAIAALPRGYIRRVPWWLFFLKPFLGAVVTKERLSEISDW